MHDQLSVCVLHCGQRLQEQSDALADTEPVAVAPGEQGFAFHELQGQVRLSLRRDAGIIKSRDVRVREPRQDVAFAGEAFGQLQMRQRAVRQLERHGALEHTVAAFGEPDRTHAAAPQFAQQAIRSDPRACLQAGGVRVGDIVQLRLGDIDWKEATVRVCGKGRCQTQMPLTQEVGDAVVDYFKAGRPHADTDVVFLRARAPFRALGSHTTVSTIVAQAMRRARVTSPSRGAAHVLRHSAAAAMLRHGASLQEISSVLRHRFLTTTEIYAKVDVTALQRIAQAWPDVQPC